MNTFLTPSVASGSYCQSAKDPGLSPLPEARQRSKFRVRFRHIGRGKGGPLIGRSARRSRGERSILSNLASQAPIEEAAQGMSICAAIGLRAESP